MRRKYITELYNLGIRRQGDNRTADELREAIDEVFRKDMMEKANAVLEKQLPNLPFIRGGK